jgi:hypothetical protein
LNSPAPTRSNLALSQASTGRGKHHWHLDGSTVLAQKRLQLARELLPKAELVALLVNPTSPVAEPQTQDAARALGLKLIVLGAVTENDFDFRDNRPAARCSAVRQRRPILIKSAQAACRACGALCYPDAIRNSRVRRSRRSDELWNGPS